MNVKKIGLVGIGNMGGAILKCMGKALPDCTITVYDKADGKIDFLSAEKNRETASAGAKIEKAKSIEQLADAADIIIFAVKPQDTDELLKEAGRRFKGKSVISVITGKPMKLFAQALQTANVCRFMPNMAALCAMSATAVSFCETASKDFIDDAVEIADSFGKTFIVPEKLISAFTGMSGSAIAFVYQFINALAMGGVKSGINYKQSLDTALAVVEGALSSLKSSGKTPVEMITEVASPAGTTIEGISVLERYAFNSAVIEAVFAAFSRAKEIESASMN